MAFVNTGQCCMSHKNPRVNVTLCDPAQSGCMGLTPLGEGISVPSGHSSHILPMFAKMLSK